MTYKDQTEQINMLTQKIMKNMASEGPDQSLFDTALENMGIKYNDNIKSNDYYYIVLNQYYNLGIDGFTGYMDALKTITKEDIRVLTEELSKENLIEVIYTPV